MCETTGKQVTTPMNSIRKTSKMARKGRVQMRENTNQQKQMSCPTTTTTKTAANTKPGHCMRPGPLQRNPYLNFLREYRKKVCGLSAVETVRRGAQAWKSLTTEQKAQYIVQAFYTRSRKNRLRNSNRLGRRHARKRKSSTRSRKIKRKARQANKTKD